MDREYDDNDGFVLGIDMATGLPKQFPEVKMVYSEFKGNIAYG